MLARNCGISVFSNSFATHRLRSYRLHNFGGYCWIPNWVDDGESWFRFIFAPAGGGTTTYAYDDASNLLSVTDPVGNVTKYTYDAENRRATMTLPTSGVTTYTYDLADNLIQTVDPLGRIIQYGYDADNRETTEKWLPVGGGAAFYTMTVAYDAAGRVSSIQDNYSSYTYGYDNADRLTSVANSGTPGSPQVTLAYAYDKDGNRTSLTDTTGTADTYEYNARNLLDFAAQSGSGANAGSVAPELAFFNYDAAGNLTSLTRYANTTATTKVATTTDGLPHDWRARS